MRRVFACARICPAASPQTICLHIHVVQRCVTKPRRYASQAVYSLISRAPPPKCGAIADDCRRTLRETNRRPRAAMASRFRDLRPTPRFLSDVGLIGLILRQIKRPRRRIKKMGWHFAPPPTPSPPPSPSYKHQPTPTAPSPPHPLIPPTSHSPPPTPPLRPHPPPTPHLPQLPQSLYFTLLIPPSSLPPYPPTQPHIFPRKQTPSPFPSHLRPPTPSPPA